MKPLDCLPLYEDADFYNLEFAERDQEIPFFQKMAQQSPGPVLEVACGTGRLTLPIARAGVDIDGLDVSAPMLESARHRSEAEGLSVAWLHQDCRKMELSRRYGLVFSATNALQHLHDVESVTAFFRSAARALTPDGRLIIDVFHPSMEKLSRPAGDRYAHKSFADAEGRQVDVEITREYLPDRQILHFDLRYFSGNQQVNAKSVNMRVFFPEELVALCQLGGLEVEQRFGDYGEGAFGAESSQQILMCRPC